MTKAALGTFPDRGSALRLASRSPMARCVQRMLEHCPAGCTVLVAASGGADSTGLALLACAVAARGPWRVGLVTVDHGLRPSSAADADFVCRLGEWLGVPVDRRSIALRAGPALAARARAGRHAAIVEAARACGGVAVLMAHHAEDQLETVLMRLVRGAGAQAAAGMPARRRMRGVLLMRPLLERSRQEVRALLERAGVGWREDPSNQDRAKPRGRIRHEVLPVLESMRRGAAVRASRAARRLQAAAKALRARARRQLAGEGPWPREPLRRVPAEVLALALHGKVPSASETQVDRAVTAIRSQAARPRRCAVGGHELRVEARWVRLGTADSTGAA